MRAYGQKPGAPRGPQPTAPRDAWHLCSCWKESIPWGTASPSPTTCGPFSGKLWPLRRPAPALLLACCVIEWQAVPLLASGFRSGCLEPSARRAQGKQVGMQAAPDLALPRPSAWLHTTGYTFPCLSFPQDAMAGGCSSDLAASLAPAGCSTRLGDQGASSPSLWPPPAQGHYLEPLPSGRNKAVRPQAVALVYMSLGHWALRAQLAGQRSPADQRRWLGPEPGRFGVSNCQEN